MATTDEVRAWVYEYLRKDVKERQANRNGQVQQLSFIEQHVKAKLQESGEMPNGVRSCHTDISVAYKDQIREIIWVLSFKGL
jgi:hypothetical protein